MAKWKKQNGYYDNYYVSDDGQVKNIITGRIKKATLDDKGYYRVLLSKDNKHKNCLVHRLVAIAFLPNPDNNPQVNHIDGNKENNNINNLEWCNNRYNTLHALQHHLRGNVKVIYQYTKDNTFIKKWQSSAEVMRELGIHKTHILECCKGKRKTAGGYKWSFEGVSV